MMRFIVISAGFMVLFAGILMFRFTDGQNPGTIQLYNWLPADRLVEYEVDDLKTYISECCIIAEIDRVELTYDRSPDTETKLTRVFHVKKVHKGNILPGTCIYDELYLEEDVSPAGISTTRHEGTYWLLLKADSVSPCSEGKCSIDRSEAYVYPYFVFGDEMRILYPWESKGLMSTN